MLQIIDKCICCDKCVSVCPHESISCDDPIYVIDRSCDECGTTFNDAECVKVCPTDAIIKRDE
jgi:ferredoxin